MAIRTTKGTMTSGKVKYKGAIYPIKEMYVQKNGVKQLFFSQVTPFFGDLEYSLRVIDRDDDNSEIRKCKIAPNGDIMVAGMDSTLHCIEKGDIKWNFESFGVLNALDIDSQGNSYIGGYGRIIYKVNKNGEKLWESQYFSATVYAVAANENIVVVAVDNGTVGQLVLLDANNGKEIKRKEIPSGEYNQIGDIIIYGSLIITSGKFISDSQKRSDGLTVYNLNLNEIKRYGPPVGAIGMNEEHIFASSLDSLVKLDSSTLESIATKDINSLSSSVKVSKNEIYAIDSNRKKVIKTDLNFSEVQDIIYVNTSNNLTDMDFSSKNGLVVSDDQGFIYKYK